MLHALNIHVEVHKTHTQDGLMPIGNLIFFQSQKLQSLCHYLCTHKKEIL
jgi:hypothetical protein